MLNKFVFTGIGVLGIAATGVGVFVSVPEEENFQATVMISMGDSEFMPQVVTIQKNTTVVFENVGKNDHWPASNIHPTHEIYPEFDPGKPIQQGERWSFRFERAGSWNFHDHLHPQFTGTITVVEERIEREEQQEVRSFPLVNSKSVLKTDFYNPSPYDLEILYQTVSLGCDSTNFSCINNAVRAVVKEYGPEAAILVLERWYTEGLVRREVDDHQLSHEIGRQTAETFGVNSQAFLLCPMSAVNGGCQHGYFEYVLGKTDTTIDAADAICKSLDEYSSKDKFYCYHGVGHGLMMAEAYDLQASLDMCDAFATSFEQEGCWQGVFMENTNAGMRGEARHGIFSLDDPLAPCSNLAEKYSWQCYMNQAGYLLTIYQHSIREASAACVHAPERGKSVCYQGLGLTVTNPVWQRDLVQLYESDRSTELEIAFRLCDEFPEEGRIDCLIGGLDTILNFDEMKFADRAIPFCEAVKGWDRHACYAHIGLNIRRQVPDSQEQRMHCAKINAPYEQDCLKGVGL